MVIKELLKNTAETLRKNNFENSIFEAHQLIRYALNLSATELVIKYSDEVDSDEYNKFSALLSRRLSGEPLQYILGTQEFMSLEFFVSPGVLIPRADTETLVEYVLDKMKDKGFSLLDIGTGTGCIPLSIANYIPRAYVRGLDVSETAIALAQKNCEHLNLSSRAVFEKLDIFTQIPLGKYDIITSNPPYIKHSIIGTLDSTVKDYEPHLALDGGEDGLNFYRRICAVAPEILNKNGHIVFEIGYDQAEDVVLLLSEKFKDIEVIKDLCGNNRVVAAVLK